jgi:3-hydroxyisobutyrate dehydrogenase-like beta-hydroxyacid dehydrogenase
MSTGGTDMTGAVGFIGLGNIGAPMAKRLVGWPDGLVVFDVRPEACEPYVAAGATAAATPAQVAEHATVICVMVQNEDQVREVLEGPDGILSTAGAGTVVAVHSTISAEGAIALAAAAAEHGVDLVDAPVSGGAMGAHDGTLAIMVGGTDDAVARCRPVLERMGTLVSHFGPVGSGTNAKITRNLITFASFAVVGEAQRLAEAAGLDLAKLGDVVRHSDRVTGGAGAVMLRPTAGVMDDDDGLRPIFEHTATLGAKDLHLAVHLAAEHGLDAPFAELGERWLRVALGLDERPDPT